MGKEGYSFAKLEGHERYQSWVESMESALLADGLWKYVKKETKEPTQEQYVRYHGEKSYPDEMGLARALETHQDGRSRAVGKIKIMLKSSPLAFVKDMSDPARIWSKLEEIYAPTRYLDQAIAFDKLVTTRYDDCKDIHEYTDRIKVATQDLKAMGAEVPAWQPVTVLLNNLGPTWSQFSTARNLTIDARNLPEFDSVVSELVAEVQRRTREETVTVNAVARSKTQSNFGTGHEDERWKLKVCFHCNQKGHISRFCPEKRNRDQGRRDDETSAVELMSSKKEPPRAKMTCTVSSVGLPRAATEEVWLLDTGASHHLTSSRSCFDEGSYEPWVQTLQSASGEVFRSIGKGSVTLVLDRDKDEDLELTITNVLHTPRASVNLIAMGALALKGVGGRILKDRILIERGTENLVGIADLVDAQYVMRVKPRHSQTGYANPVKQPVWADLQTWHRRLGHLGLSNVRRLAGMSDGLDIREDQDQGELSSCDACQQGKLTAVSSKEPMQRASEPFELVHSDIGGGGKLVPGLGKGHRYWITFLDDYTGMVWLYTMKARSDAITCLKLFNQRVRNLGASLQRLRTDNAKEYGQGHFNEYLDEQGTQWEPTAPYSPSQNGKAERVNRTLQERTTAILEDSGFSTNLWPEVMKTVVYLMNRSPKAGFDRTPFEFFYGHKPDLSHLRVIGCCGWVLIPKENRTSGLYGSKLHRKAMRCQLVGYGGRNQYRVYREDGRVVTAANVVFDEKTVGVEKQRLLAQERERVSDDDDDGEWESMQRETLYPPPSENHAAIENEDGEEDPESDDSDTIEVKIPPEPEGLRRSSRANRGQKPATYMAVSEVEPQTLNEALQSAQADEWRAAMKAEVDTLLHNETWTLEPLPEGRRALSGKWVFKIKKDQQGRIIKHKARWVVRGFEQRDGVDLQETFATVVKATTFRVLFALVAINDWELHQMDVKGAFLYGDIQEDVYVQQPEGFDLGQGVCHLRKALYGLKQSPRVWYHALKNSLESVGFRRIESDHSVFLWEEGQVIVVAYVDDLLIAGPNLDAIKTVKDELRRSYEMNNLGECSTFLNIRVTRDRNRRRIKLDQEAFATAILKRFGLDQCKAARTPMDTGLNLVASKEKATREETMEYQRMVGSLMYLMCETRPDIAFAVSTLSRYLDNPGAAHLAAAKRVFRYLQGTKAFGIRYEVSGGRLLGYSDSDWAGSRDDRKSTSGHIFLFGGGPISWSSKRQSVVATSTTEAEYIAAALATKEAVWLQTLLRELGESGSDIDHVRLRMDNTGAIALTKNPEFHQRTKHMDVRWHYIREQVDIGKIEIEYTQTSQMVADGFTKPLNATKFRTFVEQLGLVR